MGRSINISTNTVGKYLMHGVNRNTMNLRGKRTEKASEGIERGEQGAYLTKPQGHSAAVFSPVCCLMLHRRLFET